MSAVILFESKRAETAPVQREVSVEDLVHYLDRRPPNGINAADSCHYRDHCDRIVERALYDLFADDHNVFQAALNSGRTRREALIELRDKVMRFAEVRKLLADRAVARSAIVKGVHKRAAEAAWWSCFWKQPASRSLCGLPGA